MRKTLWGTVLLAAVAASISLPFGCRIRTVDPDEYAEAAPGHLNELEARHLISRLMREHNVKMSYNVALNLRGVKFIAGGFDYNLQVGYVYLIEPPPEPKPGVSYPRPPTAEERKILAELEKNQNTFIAWIAEGNEKDVTGQVNAFIERLYKAGLIFKQIPEADGGDADGAAAVDGAVDAAISKPDAGPTPDAGVPVDAGPKPPKSRVMQLIEGDDEDEAKPTEKKP
jgi:hypothetical protein